MEALQPRGTKRGVDVGDRLRPRWRTVSRTPIVARFA